MRLNVFVMSACLCVSSASGFCADTSLHNDVRRFIANADNCEHLAGESTGESDTISAREAQREIERNVIKYCGAAQRQLKALRIKYKDDVDVNKILDEHENESVKIFRSPQKKVNRPQNINHNEKQGIS
ncbi:MAG: hypothetical protein V4754_16230 [Pseudomonadota bacterium]